MKIALEASRANKTKKTGTEWYAWHMLEQFKKLDNQNQFFVYYNKDLDPILKQAPDNFIFKKLNWPFKKSWTHIRLSLDLLLHPTDKFFASNVVPIFNRGEVIATVHDLGFLKNPELYHPLERIYQKVSHWITIKKAKKIITISEASKQDIIHYYPQAKDKIKVIYLGWNQEDFSPKDEETQQRLKDKYNLADKFILYIGRVETKKNIANLIKAYKLIGSDWDLAIAGRPGNYGYDEIRALAQEDNRIKFLGYIPQEDYPDLLDAAGLFVFPSKFEGFGLPVIEAMGSGVAVACSDIPVLHEVADQAALYFDPDRVEDIAAKIKELLEDSNLRQDLIDKGLVRAQQFSWEKCARETLEYIIS